MAQLRRPLIAALALFAGAITLDRLAVAAGDDVVPTQAYLVALAALIAPLLVPALRRAGRATAVSIAVGVHVGISLLSNTGSLGGAAVHTAATAVGFVAMSAWLGHALAATLGRIDDAVAVAASGESPAVDLEGPTAASEIQTEVARARRHDRPLSVTVLAPSPDGFEDGSAAAPLEIDRSIRTRFMFGTLARAVARQLRRSDLLFEHRSAGRLVILSPETDDSGTALLVRRALDAATRTGIDVVAGSASFPDDGIGFESLLEHAEGQLQEAAAAPHLRAVERGGAA